MPVEARARICEHETIRLSLENLMGYPWVLDHVMARQLRLHGWCLDLEGTAPERLDPDSDAFVAF